MLKSPDTIGELLIIGDSIWPPIRPPSAPMTIDTRVPRCALIPSSLKPAQPRAPPARIHMTIFMQYLQEIVMMSFRPRRSPANCGALGANNGSLPEHGL